MEDKKLIVKFAVICETDTSMVIGDTYEEKLHNWKNEIADTLDDATRHWGDVYTCIECEESKIENYD